MARKQLDPRLSVLSNYTEPLPDTPTSARTQTSPLSSRSNLSTASLPPRPQSDGSKKKREGKSGGGSPSSAPEDGDEPEPDSPPLPPTPVVKEDKGTSSTPTTASSLASTSSLASSAISGSRKKAKKDEEGNKAGRVEAPEETPKAERTKRTWKHDTARIAALYLVPVVLSIPLSLILVLTRLLLQPIYNSTPLSLHPLVLYSTFALIPTALIWNSVRYGSPKASTSARVCLSVSALGGDLIAISGRRVGCLTGKLGGAEWGALGARAVLGMAVVGGGVGFATLCSDYILPIPAGPSRRDRIITLPHILVRSTVYVAHIWLGERLWMRLLGGGTSILVQSPEKSILLLSLLLTILSLFLRSTPPSTSFARSLHTAISARLHLKQPASNSLWSLLSRLPRQIFPILLLLRIPLLIIALRQQLFLRPAPPYLAARGGLRILSSERGVTGQIVVGEELSRAFRFLRCDASILGGRWVRTTPGGRIGPARTDLGDSIFATFPLQEIGLLVHRADEDDSVARTIMMSTGLQVAPEADLDSDSDKPADRALIIGLGVGIAAQAFSRQSLSIDLVETDPLVYHAAVDHFNLTLPSSTTINLLHGNEYVSSLARMRREGSYEGQKWRYVIQDCFSGGSVPEEMFTREFWTDLAENVEQDGIVAMNFVGVLNSLASRAVLVTLTSVFEQCRAFGDPAESHVEAEQSINMVVFCTNALNPLLTFRRPTPADVLRSPLRSHVYSTSQSNEIQLYDVITDEDRADPMLTLRRGEGRMDREGWQVASGLSMWYNMQKILTPEMWMAF